MSSASSRLPNSSPGLPRPPKYATFYMAAVVNVPRTRSIEMRNWSRLASSARGSRGVLRWSQPGSNRRPPACKYGSDEKRRPGTAAFPGHRRLGACRRCCLDDRRCPRISAQIGACAGTPPPGFRVNSAMRTRAHTGPARTTDPLTLLISELSRGDKRRILCATPLIRVAALARPTPSCCAASSIRSLPASARSVYLDPTRSRASHVQPGSASSRCARRSLNLPVLAACR